jgi:hypothetical protein
MTAEKQHPVPHVKGFSWKTLPVERPEGKIYLTAAEMPRNIPCFIK